MYGDVIMMSLREDGEGGEEIFLLGWRRSSSKIHYDDDDDDDDQRSWLSPLFSFVVYSVERVQGVISNVCLHCSHFAVYSVNSVQCSVY